MVKKKEELGEITKVTKNGSECQNAALKSTEPINPNHDGCLKPRLPISTPRKHYRTKKQGKTVKANITEVFRKLGGVDGMLTWAKAHGTEFYQGIYAKMLPKEADITIDNDNAKRYELPPEETQELRESAARIIQLRLAGSTVGKDSNTQ